MREKITFMPEAPHLPSGTITFLFTDIEGSTRLWEQFPVRIGQVMTRHDELIESLVEEHHGVIVRPRGEGDSRFAVFSRASEALAAADKIQRAFSKEPWDLPSPLKVRIAIHTGEANLRDGDYYGAAVNRCARLRTLAHGGQILLSQTTRSLVNGSLPKGMNLHDLGEHKLKDLKVPERIYQLIVDGLPTDFPPLRGQDNSLTNFPVALTSFIGRDHELAEVERLLTSRRLLTITGPGGSGKTRLALQAGTDLINSYPHGVWLVDLSPLSNPSYITSYFMSGLGIREEVNYAPIDTLVDFMKDKTLLILLDNCEHVLQEAAQLVGRLLQSAPNLTILATSRAPLGFQGEMVWCIPPLSTPKSEAENTPEELMKYESVRLFVERAVISRTGFHLTKSNARAVAQICIRLDGIPLAIELAAARVKVLSVEDIAARLDDRFRLLVSHQNAIPRQKTLQNLIDWSYDLLPEKEQELLQRLSVFAGGWTLSAAEEVCSGGILEPFETLDLLSYLVDKSLVIVEFREESERYHLLETIRQYAQKRLAESQDKDNFSHKHASYFTSLAQEAYGELWGSRQVYWLDRLETEHDNLRTAMKWMDQTKDSNDMLLRMAASLWRFWEIHGYLSEGRAWLELALEHCPRAAPSLRAHGLRGAGELALQQGDYERATDLHQQSLALFHEIDDKRGIGRELAVLGEIAHHQGEYSRSIGLHEKSLALRQEIGDKEGIAASLGQLGMIARDQGQYQSARELLEESLRLSRELEDKRMTAYALKSLGLVAFTMCEYPLATRFFEEAVSFYRELNDRLGISDTLQNLGNVAKDQGYFQRAADLYAECLQLKQELGDRRGVAQAISGQAEVDFYQGIYPRALELVEQGLDLFRELGVKRGIILCLGI
jgi:predicted ATPase/class 3 adenylate cyclase